MASCQDVWVSLAATSETEDMCSRHWGFLRSEKASTAHQDLTMKAFR